MENKERDAQKTLYLVGIITGVIFTFLGLIDGFYELEAYLFQHLIRGDQYTIKAIHVLGDLLAAFGLFEICFFGIKLKELKEQSNKSTVINSTSNEIEVEK